MPESLTLRQVLEDAAVRIDRIDAEYLLLHVLQRSRTWLFLHSDEAIDDPVHAAFDALLARRGAGEPVAYLIGHRGFWTLDLETTPAALIPRADTELLVELALAHLPLDAPVNVADLGTGSGAIALAIAKERPRARVIATDASPAALEVARRNAMRNGIANVEWRHGDWFAPLTSEHFAVIASNPPYIAADDPHLAVGDLRFEPMAALASGADGLDDIRRIIAGAPDHLVDGGWLLLEHGFDQGEGVRALLHAGGFADVGRRQDMEQRDRVSMGRWTGGR